MGRQEGHRQNPKALSPAQQTAHKAQSLCQVSVNPPMRGLVLSSLHPTEHTGFQQKSQGTPQGKGPAQSVCRKKAISGCNL